MDGEVKLLSGLELGWFGGSGLGKKMSSGLGMLSGKCQWAFLVRMASRILSSWEHGSEAQERMWAVDAELWVILVWIVAEAVWMRLSRKIRKSEISKSWGGCLSDACIFRRRETQAGDGGVNSETMVTQKLGKLFLIWWIEFEKKRGLLKFRQPWNGRAGGR